MKAMNRFFLIAVAVSLLSAGCANTEDDPQLAKRIFNGLCRGNQGVENLIAWQTLTAVGTDVGQTYSSFRTENDRKSYRKAFFYNYSNSFKSAGGSASQFFNWRIKSQDADKTIVAADTIGRSKVALFTISHKEKQRKLTAISWEE